MVDKMVFGIFKKKDPICGMRQERGKGFVDRETGNWFCSEGCKEEFDKKVKGIERKDKGSCCH